MTFKRTINDLNTDAHKRQHAREQEKLDFQHRMFMKVCVFLFWFLLFTIFASVIMVIAYAFQCPYISEKAIDLLIESWKFIGSYIFGGLSVKYGFKNSKD